MAVTLRDVAAKAGVSPVVVSRVLHNKAVSVRVSRETAERVRQAAGDLGYRVNVFARNFRARQTMTIGILHGIGFAQPKLDDGPRYFACLLDGLIEGAFRHGYSLTLCPKLLSGSPEDAVCDGRFDGLVWYSSVDSDENRAALSRCTVPLVLLHAKAEEFGNRHPAVICDNDQGIGLAVDHLIDLGHREIAFAYEVHPLVVESLERKAAFETHLSRHGLPSGPSSFIAVGPDHAEVDEYLARSVRHSAIIAHNDRLAAQFLRRAPHFGIEVPRDLAVVGFDSTSFCQELRPTLTSVSQPLAAMGERAIDLLVGRMADEANEPIQVVFPCGLDVRGSTNSDPNEGERT